MRPAAAVAAKSEMLISRRVRVRVVVVMVARLLDWPDNMSDLVSHFVSGFNQGTIVQAGIGRERSTQTFMI